MSAEQTIRELLEELTDVPADEISPTDHLIDDLGMDSVAAVEFLALLSDALSVAIDVDAVVDVRTVGDAVALADRRLADG